MTAGEFMFTNRDSLRGLVPTDTKEMRSHFCFGETFDLIQFAAH